MKRKISLEDGCEKNTVGLLVSFKVFVLVYQWKLYSHMGEGVQRLEAWWKMCGRRLVGYHVIVYDNGRRTKCCFSMYVYMSERGRPGGGWQMYLLCISVFLNVMRS